MRKYTLVLAASLLAALVAVPPGLNATQKPKPRALKVVLARQSTADPIQIMKHLGEKCPNVTLTTNPKRSDYMLYAGGWPGNYRFMVIAHGGDTIYATETAFLSNAVKDVCNFLNSKQ
ncbi:MAG TPA: hypothetical protein VN661_04480 [Candidatus Acidoferrales bacterium]|nr:hypothetical protein [Candidatus Acidoferrales bacterium]